MSPALVGRGPSMVPALTVPKRYPGLANDNQTDVPPGDCGLRCPTLLHALPDSPAAARLSIYGVAQADTPCKIRYRKRDFFCLQPHIANGYG